MTKRETIKFIVQMIASIATAIVTALGTTSCMGLQKKIMGYASLHIPFRAYRTVDKLSQLAAIIVSPYET